MIGLISSVPEEGENMARAIKNPRVTALQHIRAVKGKIHGREVVYAVSGIGKTNAAHAATILIEKFSPEIVVLFGVGGAYPSSGLKVGDIAVAEKEIYADEGVLNKDGFHSTELIGIPLLKKRGREYFNEFPLEKNLIKLAARHTPLVTKSGPFVTVSTCTGTKKRARELEKRFNAVCENMEGAAVAHVCAMYGTPMLEIRSISNIVEDRDKNKWDIGLAADNCRKLVMDFLKAL